MPDDVAGNTTGAGQPGSAEATAEETTTTGASEAGTEAQGETSETGKKPIKVPDSLKPKPNDQERFRGRISELVNSRKALEQEAQQLRSELALLKGGKTERTTPEKAADGKPSPDDFETYQDYVDALVEHKLQSKLTEQQKHRSEEDQRVYREEKRLEFEQHAHAIVEQVPEFWDAVSDPTLPVTNEMAEAVMELGEMAPFTMLWLASNRQEALRIAKLPARAATVAIAKLAVQLEKTLTDGNSETTASTEQAKPQFQPKPVPQIRGGAPGNLSDGPSDKDDARTWMHKEAERQRKKFGNPNFRVYTPR